MPRKIHESKKNERKRGYSYRKRLLIRDQDLDSQIRFTHRMIGDGHSNPKLSVLRSKLEQSMTSVCECIIVPCMDLNDGKVSNNLKVLLHCH